MTNSPIYDQQLALTAYWDLIGGNKFLPGTISAADRFVRLSYNLKSSPKYEDPKMAVSSVFSQIRAISVPLGLTDPDHPNISMTLWRCVADQTANVYYFETALMPAVMWVDLNKVDFEEGSGVRSIPIDTETVLAGEVSSAFKSGEAFEWMN
jgi:choloylglycine hydrolase